jgi:hypothetical protein
LPLENITTVAQPRRGTSFYYFHHQTSTVLMAKYLLGMKMNCLHST